MFLTIYQKWVSSSVSTVTKACEDTLNTQYPEEVNGEGKEAFTARILGYLNLEKVTIVPRNTVADEICKWDILLQVDADRVFPLQVKSSDVGRVKYESSTPKLKYREIDRAPCLVVEQKFDRARFGLSILNEIFQALKNAGADEICLNGKAKEALDLHKALKASGVKEIPAKAVPVVLKGDTAKILKDLGLGASDRGNFILF
jgi:hypothetical protein